MEILSEVEELTQLKALLALEKEADYEQHKLFIERLPLEERKKKGYTWYPLNVIKKGFTFGDRVFVTVERTNNLDEPHQFRAGKLVNLYTKDPAVKKGERSGVIYFVKRDQMKIILNAREIPDWLGYGMLGVDLMFDDRTYLVMNKAVETVMKAKGDRLAELRSILLGHQPAKFLEDHQTIHNPALNNSQNVAVNQALAARDVAVIHGPPGTGKTTTIVQIVKVLCEREHTVLVTAPSNTAVDLLTERLVAVGLNVVRIGNISRVDEQIIRHTLDVQLTNHPEAKNIKKLKKQADEYYRLAGKYKRKYGRGEKEQRRKLYKEASELSSWANQLEQRLIDQIIAGAAVITCTLIGAESEVLQKRTFKTVVIDEAAQALEGATWVPVTKCSKVILAGDPHQLPPTVKSKEAQKAGLNVTLIEKCLSREVPSDLLRTQYRMHEIIMNFSNHQFYGGALQAHETVKAHQLDIPNQGPLLFIDTAGCGFEEELEPVYQSRFNPNEFRIMVEHLLALQDQYDRIQEEHPNIALISPYREQIYYMERNLEDSEMDITKFTINTIDGFQGQERDIVYISLVRSNSKGEIGFLSDIRRMNVAMTRARKKLIVIGDSATIASHPFYQAFLDYCEKYGEYQTAWEYMQ